MLLYRAGTSPLQQYVNQCQCPGMAYTFVPTCGLQDWRDLLADPEKHWRAGYSAMAAAQSWEAANGLPPEMHHILGPGAELLLAIPEHKVALPGGARPSQCDIFALVRNQDETTALSVEAKVAEPFDRTLSDWMGAASPGKRERLAAICALLGCTDPPGHLRYQLFHRTAAAVIEAARFGTHSAAMIVQSFSQDHQWYEDFVAFCDFLGLEAARDTPLIRAQPDGRNLTLGWVTGDPVFLTDSTTSGAPAGIP